MQDFFQEGIPVVGRFLSEFLSDWDGKEFFIQIMCLLAHIQITEYQGKYILWSIAFLETIKFAKICQNF